MNRCNWNRKGLSLTEALIAISLAMVLAALALVALSHARVEAKAVENLRNHREIVRALIQSTYDHNGALPYCDHGPGVKLSFPRYLAQGGYISDYRVFFSPFAGDWYTKHRSNLARPSVSAVVPWFYTNYGANRRGAMPHALDDAGRRPARLPAVAQDGNLSKLMLLRDTYRAGYDTEAEPFGGGVCFFTGGSGWPYLPPVKRTYRGYIHASFADGHVERIPRSEMQGAISGGDEYAAPFFRDRYIRD